MKKILILLIIVSMFSCKQNAQTTIAKWTFPTGTSSDANPDVCLATNTTKAVSAVGTTSIDLSKNGNTTKAAQASGWDNGNGTKYWQIEVSTVGYQNLKLSSRQQSGGSFPGPKDYKLQYKIGNAGIWTDITGGTITTANDWTTSYVNNLALPTECANQGSVFIRWLMNSNLNSAGGTVTADGTTKIDDIMIAGDLLTGISKTASIDVRIYPNPTSDYLFIETLEAINGINIFSQTGSKILEYCKLNENKAINISHLSKGLYMLEFITNKGRFTKLVMVN